MKRETLFRLCNAPVCGKAGRIPTVHTRTPRRVHPSAERVTERSEEALQMKRKIRIRSLPISSLLLLLHWNTGDDGEPSCACAGTGCQQMGERWCTFYSGALHGMQEMCGAEAAKLGIKQVEEWLGWVTDTKPVKKHNPQCFTPLRKTKIQQ